MDVTCSNRLRLYSSISATRVDWLWFPYIPFGKLTMVQGDPGCGKSTMMIDVVSALSSGHPLPDGHSFDKPVHVIYQCSEDGISDTIKPRLMAAGADCNNVAFIYEENSCLTLSDDSIREAIEEYNARLLVLDPVQAYIGDTSMSSASSMRRVLKQLSVWANEYNCAIVLISHLNKSQNTKDLYRGLESIDLIATSRSVIEVSRYNESPDISMLRHIKSSISARGSDLYFQISPLGNIQWIDSREIAELDEDCELSGNVKISKQEQAAILLKDLLADAPVRSLDALEYFENADISERTVMAAKKLLGIRSFRKKGIWFWELPANARNY